MRRSHHFLRPKLKGSGYNVLTAGNGIEALEQTKTQEPDVVVLDLIMPGMDGKEFLMHAKAHGDMCGIPVVVLTTSASELDIDECYEMHAAGYIQKPASPEELKDVMENIVTYWRTSCLLARGRSSDDAIGSVEKACQ